MRPGFFILTFLRRSSHETRVLTICMLLTSRLENAPGTRINRSRYNFQKTVVSVEECRNIGSLENMARPFGHPCAKRVFATLPQRNHHFWMHHVSSRHRKRALLTTSKFVFFATPHVKSLLFTFSRVQHKVLATMRLELEVGRRCWIFGFQDCQK